MADYIAKKAAGPSAQLVNDWLSPVVVGNAYACTAKYRRQSFVGSFRIGIQWLDEAGAVLSTSWSPTINTPSTASDANYVDLSSGRVVCPAGGYQSRFVIEVGGTVNPNLGSNTGQVWWDTTTLDIYSALNLDFLPDGLTWGRTREAYLNDGRVKDLFRGGGMIAATDLFQHSGVGANTIDNVLDGTSFRKTGSGYVDGSGRINNVFRNSTLTSVNNLFNHVSDTLDIIPNGAQYGKPLLEGMTDGYSRILSDGHPFRANDEVDGRALATRITGINDMTVTAYENNSERLILTAGLSAPYFSPGLLKRGTHLEIRYELSDSCPSMEIYGVTSGAIKTFGLPGTSGGQTRTVMVDMRVPTSGSFTAGEVLRIRGFEKSVTFTVYSMSVGQPGSGLGGVYSYWPTGNHGYNTGFNDFTPGARVTIDNKGASQPALSIGSDNNINNSGFGLVHITKPADTVRAHLAFIRAGVAGWYMAFANGSNNFGFYYNNLPGTVTPQIEMQPGVRNVFRSYNNWDIVNGDGDFLITDTTNTYKLKIGHASGGGGAGALGIAVTGGTNILALGSGTTSTKQNAIVITDGATQITQAAWISLPFSNSWANYGGGFYNGQYRLLSDGRVELRGLIARASNPGIGTTFAVLPAGYRPSARMGFTQTAASRWCRVDIDTSGNMTVDGADSASWWTFVFLDGICFSRV